MRRQAAQCHSCGWRWRLRQQRLDGFCQRRVRRPRARQGDQPGAGGAERYNFCGNNNCRVIDVTQNSCHAFADSSQDGYWYAYASGGDPQVAQEPAHINCAGFAAAPATCQVRYSICQ